MAETKKRRADSDGAWRTARSRVKTRVRYGEKCVWCGERIDLSLPKGDDFALEVDHWVPVSKGGHLTSQKNLFPSHAWENRARADMDADVWRQFRSELTYESWKAGTPRRRRYKVGRCKHGCDMHNARTAAMHDPAREPAYPGVWRWSEVHGCWSPASRAW